MESVELTSMAGALVGTAPGLGEAGVGGGALSLEARKRLSLAVELVAGPALVFLDEPTTGERSSIGLPCWEGLGLAGCSADVPHISHL